MPRRLRHVALIYHATLGYDMKVIAGIAAYLQEHEPWNVYIEENSLKDQRLPALRTWAGDGIIANFDHPRVATAVMRSKLPAVAFGSGYGWYSPGSAIPYFSTNKKAVAHMAADHLINRGFRRFAYCGHPHTRLYAWSSERERAFVQYVKEQGFPCDVYCGRFTTGRNWPALESSLCGWLESLTKPVGILAANDCRGRQVLEACRTSGIRVPEEVAVIGVDNDEFLCQLSSPLLSSVEQGARRIGYEAAATLDHIMAGGVPRQKLTVIDPTVVVTRRSTDVFASSDPKVSQAMAFIWEHACNGIKVREVAEAVSCSRAIIESRFRSVLGKSVHAAIRGAQMERASRMLYDSTLSLKEIAAQTGFKTIQHMTTVVTKTFGHSPAAYRRLITSGGKLSAQKRLTY